MLPSWLRWSLAALAVSACGGNVFVDGGSTGDGGADASSASSSSVGVTVGASASSTGAGGIPACETLGYVAVGAPCTIEGQSCTMHVCCGGVVQCVGDTWTATVPPCTQPCDTCVNGLACEGGAVCIIDQVHDVQRFARCAADACAPGPTGCPCDGALCTDELLTCIHGANGQITCSDGTR